MKFIKVILNLFIFFALIAVGYIYADITNVSYDWLGEGKNLSILCLTTLSLVLLRFALQAGSKMNLIHISLAITSVLASIYLIKNTSVLLDYWRFGIFIYLTQSSFALWGRLNLTSASTTQRILFLAGLVLVGLCLLIGWFSSFAYLFIGIALLITTVISITALFKNRIS